MVLPCWIHHLHLFSRRHATLYEALSIHWSVGPSVGLSVRPSVCLLVPPSVRLSICLSVHPSICLSVRPSIRLSVPSSVLLSISMCQKVGKWAFLDASVGRVCPSVCRSICPLVHLYVHPLRMCKNRISRLFFAMVRSFTEANDQPTCFESLLYYLAV